MAEFRIHSDFSPKGDQPKAIEELLQGLDSGQKHQILLGVTGSGKTFTITAAGVSEDNFYIQSATLNGEAFNQTSITHEQITAGGELKLVMGATPNKSWGIAAQAE